MSLKDVSSPYLSRVETLRGNEQLLLLPKLDGVVEGHLKDVRPHVQLCCMAFIIGQGQSSRRLCIQGKFIFSTCQLKSHKGVSLSRQQEAYSCKWGSTT